MFNVDSKLFEIASRFASTEVSRYYLRGVCVEPCEAGGVALVATDGHRMFIAYDAEGSADQTRIVYADKAMLSQCRKAERLASPCVDPQGTDKNGNKQYRADVMAGESLSGSGLVGLVDGTYPDWRRVVPTERPTALDTDATFNGSYLADLGKAATDLAKREGARHGFMRLLAPNTDDPAVVEFDLGPAFALIMPSRAGFNNNGIGLMDRINAKETEVA